MSDEASGGVAGTSIGRGSPVGNGRGVSVGNSGNDVGLVGVHGNVDGLVDWGG